MEKKTYTEEQILDGFTLWNARRTQGKDEWLMVCIKEASLPKPRPASVGDKVRDKDWLDSATNERIVAITDAGRAILTGCDGHYAASVLRHPDGAPVSELLPAMPKRVSVGELLTVDQLEDGQRYARYADGKSWGHGNGRLYKRSPTTWKGSRFLPLPEVVGEVQP